MSESEKKRPSSGTKLVRLVVLLEPETHAVVKAMSQAGGISMSAFVASMVEEARPQMKQIADAMNMAKRDRLEAFDMLAETITGMLHEGMGVAVELNKKRREAKEKPAGKRKPK